MKKRFFGILAALCLCLALCVSASAANGTKLETSHGGQTLSSGEYYLDGDVTISQTITVSGTVTLDLNGHVLQYKNDEVHGSPLVVEDGAHLTIQDSGSNATHTFAPNSDGLWVLDENGSETVTGGVITGGTGYPYQLYSTVNCGGGVYIAPGGQLTEQGQFSMSGGSIIGCSAESGGGVCAFGKFQMSGQAVIRSCTAEGTSFNCGGGVYVDGSFEMSGEAIIEGCQAISEYAYGGGVFVNSSRSFVMSEKAKIEGCQAISTPSSPSKGGGVHLANNTEFTLSGSAVIQNCKAVNSDGSGKAYGGGVSAACVKEITLADSARIAGCTAANGSGLYITGSLASPDAYGKLYANGGSVDGDVVLGDKDKNDGPCTITGSGGTVFNGKVTVTPGSTIESGTFNGEVINNGTISGGSAVAPVTVDAGSTATKPADPTKSGHNFGGWYKYSTLQTPWDFANGTVTADTTLYAKWTANPPAPSYDDSDPTYAVSAPAAENGSVTVSPKNASAGSTVTITVKPDSGYVLETISATDRNGNDLKLTDKGNGKYTFTMPTSKVEIKVTFMEDNSVLNFFYDVPNGAYYYDAVKWAVDNGITGGVGNSLFAPNQPCTRGQIVTFLWRAAGSPVVNYAMNMTDVAEDAYYGEAVRWALSEGITTGIGDTAFGPDAACTRAQAVAFLFRYAVASGMDAVTLADLISGFADAASVPGYAVSAMNWALSQGIMQGSGTQLLSGNTCTRAQIVTFLYRAYQGK